MNLLVSEGGWTIVFEARRDGKVTFIGIIQTPISNPLICAPSQ
jgi:hypothetical protein